MKTFTSSLLSGALVFSALISTSCENMSGGGSGALMGGGIGALIGEAVREEGATKEKGAGDVLLGGAIGAGLGYLIGDSADKTKAAKQKTATPDEMKPLAGTTWKVILFEPQPDRPLKSMVSKFANNGTVTTTTVWADGQQEKDTERYRVVEDTLIINERGYLINSKFVIQGDKMILETNDTRMELARL